MYGSEQVLAGKRSGDTPASPPDLSAQRHILRFDVAAETFALFRDAMNELRRRSATALDDDSALLEMARHVLGGPREGRASYQVVLNVRPECDNGRQQAMGGLVPVDPDVIRMAHCDAQHLGSMPDPSSAPANDLEPDESRGDHPDMSESCQCGPRRSRGSEHPREPELLRAAERSRGRGHPGESC